MTGAKDHNSLTDVSSYFQHTQSSDDDFEEFIPPQSKRSSLAGKLATLRSADSSTGKRSKKGTQPAKQSASDDAMMTGAKDHNSLTDVSSYFQHTQSSDA